MSSTAAKPVMALPTILGAVLVALRMASRIRQADLAEAVGISQPAWSKVEHGVTVPTLVHMALAARALNVSLSDLTRYTEIVTAFLERHGFEVQVRGCSASSTGGTASLCDHTLAALVAEALSDACASGTGGTAWVETHFATIPTGPQPIESWNLLRDGAMAKPKRVRLSAREVKAREP